MKIQTDFGRLVETVLSQELEAAGITARDVEVVESQTNTYALVRLRVGQNQHELRVLREEGTGEASIQQRIAAWIKATLANAGN